MKPTEPSPPIPQPRPAGGSAAPQPTSKPAARPAPAKQHLFPALEFAAKPIPAEGKGAVEMADGSFRTKDQVVIASLKRKHALSLPPWIAARLPARLVTSINAFGAKLPRWTPQAALAGLIVILVVSTAFLATQNVNLFGVQIFGTPTRNTGLPKAGVVPADGKQYDVQSAAFQLPDKVQDWMGQVARANAGEGKVYTSLDGTCQSELTRVRMTSPDVTLDQAIEDAEKTALSQLRTRRAEVTLEPIKVKAAGGEQSYEFIRKRHSYVSQANIPLVSEISVRTLGAYRLQIVETCPQDSWDQSESGRFAIIESTRVATE